MSLDKTKAAIKSFLGRDVGIEKTRFGKFICKFVDYDNPHPANLVGETEELAYQNLLTYLQERAGKGTISPPQS